MTGISSTWVLCRCRVPGLVIVAQTAVEAAGRISYGRYGPRPEAEELLEMLADHRGIKPEQVFVAMARTKVKADSRPLPDWY
jgi:hypothetical protein